MPCYHPIDAYPGLPGSGRGIVFTASKSYQGAKSFKVPCGQCIGCRMAKAQDWSTRLCHEASMHEQTSFITLTYSDENLPAPPQVSVRHVQLFMKRLRKMHGPMRFFAAAEYGDRTFRPHYHILLFGFQFPDLKPWRRTGSGHVSYRSEKLEKVWTLGHSEVGTFTPSSAGYVARYCLKKVNGDLADERYRHITAEGQVLQLHPEFITMSSRPGIGMPWLERYRDDCFPSDFVVINGAKKPIPSYYLRKENERQQLLIKSKRKVEAAKQADNNTSDRLAVREEVQQLRVARLHRNMDNEQ